MLQKVTMTDVDRECVYGQTLQQIKEQKGDLPRLGMEVLMWVSHAERPLRIKELCHALAADVEATDLDPKNILLQDTILGSCLGLVMVDKETSVVRLIHHTLQEYLSRPWILPGAHKRLGEICLAYLNYDQVKGLPVNNAEDPEHMPFLRYSSIYWGAHAKIELSDCAKTLALGLLNRYGSHISYAIFCKKKWPSCYIRSHGFTGLHCASYFGVDGVVAALIEMKVCDINQADSDRNTPLMWAVRQGNHGVVRLLLSYDRIDPDKAGSYLKTPLMWASENGDERMVKLLIRGGANPNEIDIWGETALMKASAEKHMDIVALLQPGAAAIFTLD